MASFNHIFALLAVCAILTVALGQSSQGGPHTSQGGTGGPQGGPGGPQGGPHENQGRTRRQANQGGDDDDSSPVQWTACDYNVDPRLSCIDCHTRLICKPIGGLVKACQNPNRPYCNNGLCSPVPSDGCA